MYVESNLQDQDSNPHFKSKTETLIIAYRETSRDQDSSFKNSKPDDITCTQWNCVTHYPETIQIPSIPRY